MFFQELLGIVAALAQTHIAVVEPGAALLHDAQLDAQVQDLAQFGDTLAEHDVELRLTEGGRHLVLDDLGAGTVADERAGGILEALDAAHVDAHAGIVFQRAAAGGDFGVAVDHAHFFTQLVDEDADRVGLADDAGQLAQSLAHQAGLQAHVAVAHLAFDLGPGHHGRHGVHHDGVDSAGAHQRFADLHGLLAGVRLADQQAVDVHAQRAGVGGVQGVLHIDESHFTAHLLGFGQHLQGQGGLAGGFRPVYFHDTAPGHTADAQRQVQAQAAGGDGVHLHGHVGAQLHDGAFAELLFDLRQRRLQRGLLVGGRAGALGGGIFLRCHVALLLFCCKLRLPRGPVKKAAPPDPRPGAPLRRFAVPAGPSLSYVPRAYRLRLSLLYTIPVQITTFCCVFLRLFHPIAGTPRPAFAAG